MDILLDMAYNRVKNGKKQCNGPCGLIKNIDEFEKRTDNGRPRSECRECRRLKGRIENMSPEQIEQRRTKNRIENMTPEQIEKKRERGRMENLTSEQQERKKAYNRIENMSPERLEKERARRRIENMTPEQIEKQRNCRKTANLTQEQLDQKYNAQKERRLKRLIKNPSLRMKENVSAQIFNALKKRDGSKKKESVWKYLPYNFEQLIQHIQNQFEFWMNWKNQGAYNPDIWNDNDPSTWTWQLDHIKPHSTFHYETMGCQEFRNCWALSNLRPLSAKQNNIDGGTRIRH